MVGFKEVVFERCLGPVCLRESRYQPNASQQSHTDPSPQISLILAGIVEETHAHRCRRYPVLSAVVKSHDSVHSNRYGSSGARVFSLIFEKTRLQHSSLYRWIDSGSLAQRLLQLRTCAKTDDERGEPHLQYLTERIVADACREPGDHSSPPRWWNRAVQLVHVGEAAGLTVDTLATALGVHPVYLARVCRRQLGCTMVAYLRRVRTQHAAGLLVDSELPLTQAALRSGFSDQAHLCRAFRREFGVTPGAYRRQVVR